MQGCRESTFDLEVSPLFSQRIPERAATQFVCLTDDVEILARQPNTPCDQLQCSSGLRHVRQRSAALRFGGELNRLETGSGYRPSAGNLDLPLIAIPER